MTALALLLMQTLMGCGHMIRVPQGHLESQGVEERRHRTETRVDFRDLGGKGVEVELLRMESVELVDTATFSPARLQTENLATAIMMELASPVISVFTFGALPILDSLLKGKNGKMSGTKENYKNLYRRKEKPDTYQSYSVAIGPESKWRHLAAYFVPGVPIQTSATCRTTRQGTAAVDSALARRGQTETMGMNFFRDVPGASLDMLSCGRVSSNSIDDSKKLKRKITRAQPQASRTFQHTLLPVDVQSATVSINGVAVSSGFVRVRANRILVSNSALQIDVPNTVKVELHFADGVKTGTATIYR